MLQVPTIIVVFYITISRFFRSLPFETFVICLMVGINFNINSQDNKACNIWVTVIVGTCNVRGYCQYLTNIFFFFLEKTWFRLEYLQNIILNDNWHVSFCMTTTTKQIQKWNKLLFMVLLKLIILGLWNVFQFLILSTVFVTFINVYSGWFYLFWTLARSICVRFEVFLAFLFFTGTVSELSVCGKRTIHNLA